MSILINENRTPENRKHNRFTKPIYRTYDSLYVFPFFFRKIQRTRVLFCYWIGHKSVRAITRSIWRDASQQHPFVEATLLREQLPPLPRLFFLKIRRRTSRTCVPWCVGLYVEKRVSGLDRLTVRFNRQSILQRNANS